MSFKNFFEEWWKYYFYKGLYPDMTHEELKEVSSYEPADSGLVEMARNRSYTSMRKNNEFES